MADSELNSRSLQDVGLTTSSSETTGDGCGFDGNDEPVFVKTEMISDESNEAGSTDLSYYPAKRPRTYFMDNSLNSTVTNVQPETQHPTVSSFDDSFDRPLVIVGDSKWTTPATGLLLDLYIQNEDKFNSPHIKKKLLWRKISERLNEAGHMFDSDKCERKFLNLKTTYRYTVDHNLQTGNQKRCAFYDQLDSIFKFQASAEASAFYKENNSNKDDTIDTSSSHLNRPIPPPDRGSVMHAPHPAFPVMKNDASSIHSNAQYMNRLTNAVSGAKANHHVTMATRHDPVPVSHQNSPVNSVSSPTDNFSRQHFPRFPQATHHRNVSGPNTSTQHPNNNSNDNNHTRRPPTYVIEDNGPPELPSSSGSMDESETSRFQRGRKRKQTELDYLLATFERYCDEQRDREEKRLKCMKEWHDEEMKVMNRFLDIIQQSIQSGKS
ncbi:trihelix transcription factor GT-2-like [Pecten maximus]|uniref:trihelix transcription factor GT-2-like n=1 Tax=Pecten maximus TaxID=6579 RepID=UPI001458D281|nr:trihelix transcription factor GT-2-like [Pecten maximus]